jgi:hypothetical protein
MFGKNSVLCTVDTFLTDEVLQVRNVSVDRHLDLEDSAVTLHEATDYTKFIFSHGSRKPIE